MNHERAELVARAYGPGATADDMRALAAYERAAASATASTQTGTDDATPSVEAPAPADSELVPVSRVTASGRRRVGAAFVLGVVILASGIGIGVALSTAPATAPSANASARAKQRDLLSIEKSLPAFPPLENFDYPQSQADVPDVAIPGNLVKSTFRAAGFDGAGLPLTTHVYVAKDTTNYDCVVAVHSGSLSSVCVSGRYFPASGLTLTWTDAGKPYTVSWLPDGTMTLRVDG